MAHFIHIFGVTSFFIGATLLFIVLVAVTGLWNVTVLAGHAYTLWGGILLYAGLVLMGLAEIIDQIEKIKLKITRD